MKQALREASKASEEQEVPIGAVIVMNDRIIARAFNQVEKLTDSTAHAEIIALTSAFNSVGAKYLPDATLYVTIEPCIMCAGALYWCKIGRVVFGAHDVKNGYNRFMSHSNWEPSSKKTNTGIHHPPFHPQTEIITGICHEECGLLIKDFFKARR